MPDSPNPQRFFDPEWVRTGLLVGNLAWTTLCLGGAAPESRAATAAMTAALVAAHAFDPRVGTRVHAAGLLFLPFLAYAALNGAFVSPVPWLGWADWINWLQMIAVFWVVLNGIRSRACVRVLAGSIVALAMVGAAMAAYQHFVRPDWIMTGRTQADQFIGRSSGSFGIPNSLGTFMALLIPPVGAVVLQPGRPRRERVFCALAFMALLLGFVLAVSRGAWISLALAFAVKPLLDEGRSLGRRLAGTLGVVALAGVCACVLYVSFPLMKVRIDQLAANMGERTRPIMWKGALGIFRDHPVLGAGAGGFEVLFERYRPEGYQDNPVFAHCDYLNTLCDYGVVGFILFFGAVAVVAWRCSRARGLAGAAFTGLLAFYLHLGVDFHLKIPALAMMAATLAALVVQRVWPQAPAAGPRGRILAWACALAVILWAGLWAVPFQRSEAFRREARFTIDHMAKLRMPAAGNGMVLASVRDKFSRAIRLNPANARAWSDRAYVESLLALAHPEQTGELGAQVVRDADRAVAISPMVPEFWIRKGTGLDMQGRWAEGGDCFVQALQLAPHRADTWYYQAYHLSLNPRELEPAAAAADVCLRLDPGFLLAQILRQRLAIQLNGHP